MNITNHPKDEAPSEPILRNLYTDSKKSTHDIAVLYGVNQTKVRRWLDRAGIETRTYAESAKITRNGFKDGEKHWNWVGDKVSYSSLHAWVRKHKGTPQSCEFCKTTGHRKYEWANKDHKYKRNLDDWIRLCTSCHRKYDKSNNLKD